MRILFVDDEAGIRLTLAPILESNGFQVTTAATVPEALEKIHSQTFDVLVSDLNIGEPGDGFTVVSAMRRLQPDACTFILTGYPDFETALQAIRSQVDDYLLKPTDVPTLLSAIRQRLDGRRPHVPHPPCKRVPELLREFADDIAHEWLNEVKSNPELRAVGVHDDERLGPIPDLVIQLADQVDSGKHASEKTRRLGSELGKERALQHYSIPLLVIGTRLLQRSISLVLQRNLIRMDLSTVISDMLEAGEALQEQLEYAIRSFQKMSREAA